jgi:hypothetical protein
MTVLSVISAKYLFDYKIKFEFSDGKSTITDFGPFISDPHTSTMNSKYLDIEKFKKFKIMSGRNIAWGKDWEMCFCFDTIYKGGKIMPIDRNKLNRQVIKHFGKKKAEKMFDEV